MNVSSQISQLYDKDTAAALDNLRNLEKVSEYSSLLYPYFDQFLEMIKDHRYVVRLRGFRLLCKQAKWDKENKIKQNLDKILDNLNDEKPTAIRQKLAAIQDIINHQPELRNKIKMRVKSLDYSQFKDTMRPLIEKDVREVLQQIDGYLD